MRMRYHNLDLPGQRCISVLSMDPQIRAMFTMQSRAGNPVSVAWPHLIFSFRYNVVEGGYLYGGLSGDGLRVFVKGTPLTSFDDNIGFCPTEHHQYGMSCTDHGWDGALFKTHTELIATILEIWWGSPHHIGYHYGAKIDMETWKKMTVPDAVAYDWSEKTPLRNVITELPKKAEMIDEPAPPMKSVFKAGPKRYGMRY